MTDRPHSGSTIIYSKRIASLRVCSSCASNKSTAGFVTFINVFYYRRETKYIKEIIGSILKISVSPGISCLTSH